MAIIEMRLIQFGVVWKEGICRVTCLFDVVNSKKLLSSISSHVLAREWKIETICQKQHISFKIALEYSATISSCGMGSTLGSSW
jgi:hypothetical protein